MARSDWTDAPPPEVARQSKASSSMNEHSRSMARIRAPGPGFLPPGRMLKHISPAGATESERQLAGVAYVQKVAAESGR